MSQIRAFVFAGILMLGLSHPCLAGIIGPYSGQVIDSQTGEPVEGASVLFYWVNAIPHPLGVYYEAIGARLIYTDGKGRYTIPTFFANLGLMSFLDSTNIIIYQPGYQAYIIELHPSNPLNPFSDPEEGDDATFKEKNNIVKLARIPPNFSHKEHLDRIEHALWGIDDYSPGDPTTTKAGITWEEALKLNLKAVPEKEEFLRRLEWEARRGMSEDRW
ncbi:MAG: hypothetical protein HZB32_00275 [Nitrospirae bacterium]|nr:hypothetical protein [Nitrospirota bacterium]